MEDNKEIVKWLSHMNFEGTVIPVPNTTLENSQLLQEKPQFLDRMKAHNENPNLRYLRTAIAETSAEDTALSKEISDLINKLQISPQTLANDIKDNLHKISVVLRSESLSDVDETAMIICVDGNRVAEKKQRRINRELKAKYKELLHRHAVLERKLDYLKENVASIRDSIAVNEAEYKDEYSSYKLLTAKLTEYNATASAIESEIDSMNLKELEPNKIMDKYDRFMRIRGQLAEINQALIPYSNLPPNLLQAKAVLETKEIEYNDITRKFFSMT